MKKRTEGGKAVGERDSRAPTYGLARPRSTKAVGERDSRAPTYGLARPRSTQRQLRVAEEIRHVLAGLFSRHELHDPDLAAEQITVIEVRISPDLRNAMAFVSRLGRSDVDVLLPALRRAAPFLRAEVAHALRLKFAPDLTFQPDHALDHAMEIDRLLHSPEVARDLD